MAYPSSGSSSVTHHLNVTTADVQKLRLEPGDTLLIGLPAGTKQALVDVYKDAFAKAFPNNHLIVVDKKVTFTVISPTQSAEVEADLRRIAKGLE